MTCQDSALECVGTIGKAGLGLHLCSPESLAAGGINGGDDGPIASSMATNREYSGGLLTRGGGYLTAGSG